MAGARLSSANEAARTGLQYEGLVWRQVIQRLDRRSQPRPDDPAYAPPLAQTRVVEKREPEPTSDPEMDEMRDIVLMRRKMAERLAAFAESHKDDVWTELKSRIESRRKRGLLSFFRTQKPESDNDELDRLLDTVPFKEPALDTGPGLGSVVQPIKERRRRSQVLSDLANEREGAIWDRVSGSIMQREAERAAASSGSPTSWRWAFAGAAAAAAVLFVSAPMMGFSNPVAEATRFVGQHLGITETDSPPTPTSDMAALIPTASTAAEASELLGVPVAAPESLPGFTLTSSQFFPEPITADGGGTFVLTYQGENAAGSVVVYQELPSGVDLAAGSGSATDVELADGTPATYLHGDWDTVSGGGLGWDVDGTQMLLFERDGVRTIVSYSGPTVGAEVLVSLADHLR